MSELDAMKSFGGTAAEDDDIKRFFVKTPAFSEIFAGEKSVVVGRKGSGKTALYIAVQDAAGDQRKAVAPLNFSSYPWATHAKYVDQGADSTEKYVSSWTFLILASAVSSVLERGFSVGGRPQTDAKRDLEEFLKKNYGSVHLDFRRAFPEGGIRVDGIQGGGGLGPVTGSAGVHVGRDGVTFSNDLSRVNAWIQAKLEILRPSIPECFVLFDELDMGYDPARQEYIDRVVGLLIAARRISAWRSRVGVSVYPVVFLRSDIFEGLHFGDKNKIRSANLVELSWNDDLDYHGSSLKQLIDFRIEKELSRPGVTGDRAWASVFHPKLMRGTQHKFQHISYRSFLRPRDIITFCNLALKEAKLRVERDPAAIAMITNEDIRAARSKYSRYFKFELDDEISEAHPEWQQYLEVLRSVGAAKFEMGEYVKAALPI